MLKTVQVTLPEELLDRLDRFLEELKMTRSSFARRAFEEEMLRLEVEAMERQHAQAYAQQPQDPEELKDWESVRSWSDSWPSN